MHKIGLEEDATFQRFYTARIFEMMELSILSAKTIKQLRHMYIVNKTNKSSFVFKCVKYHSEQNKKTKLGSQEG